MSRQKYFKALGPVLPHQLANVTRSWKKHYKTAPIWLNVCSALLLTRKIWQAQAAKTGSLWAGNLTARWISEFQTKRRQQKSFRLQGHCFYCFVLLLITFPPSLTDRKLLFSGRTSTLLPVSINFLSRPFHGKFVTSFYSQAIFRISWIIDRSISKSAHGNIFLFRNTPPIWDCKEEKFNNNGRRIFWISYIFLIRFMVLLKESNNEQKLDGLRYLQHKEAKKETV